MNSRVRFLTANASRPVKFKCEIRLMDSRPKFSPAKGESAMQTALDPEPAATALRRENPMKGWTDEGMSQLLRRAESGQALTLAEYVRAEEVLERSVCAEAVRL
jgi:hypothetical protein